MRNESRTVSFAAISLSTFMCAACGSAGDPVGTETQALSTSSFQATLSGSDEVPTNDSQGRGELIVDASSGTELSYKLIVAHIDNVVAAHIHCGAPGVSGPVGVTLFRGGPITQNGVLAEATVVAPDTNNGCGWLDIGDVIDAIVAGNAYANAHTTAFPRGEIRGQLK